MVIGFLCKSDVIQGKMRAAVVFELKIEEIRVKPDVVRTVGQTT